MMETTVFKEREVVALLKQYVEVRIHAQLSYVPGEPERIALMEERFDGDITLPKYEIVDPKTKKRIDVFYGVDPVGNRFKAFLEKNLKKR